MIVFKYYLKVAKSYLNTIIVYTAIFIFLAVLTSGSGAGVTDFEAQTARIAMVNHDQDTPFIINFEQYIKDSAQLISLDADEESLKDALFFRQVDYIMIIPENYTSDFMAGKDVQIDVMTVPDSTAAIYSRELMNRYLNFANLYIQSGIPEDVFAKRIREDLSQEATVHLTSPVVGGEISSVRHFYNFANYTLLAITVVIVSVIMFSFREDKIKSRNLISPISYKKINRQLLLGSIVFSTAIWLLYVGVSFLLYTDTMLSMYGLLFICNSAVFMTTVLAISFLVATMSNNKEVISGASNLISLGTSFVAGAFVPQEFLGSFVIFIARFTPSYWYITNNNNIVRLSTFKISSLETILLNMAVMLGFSFMFYIIAHCISRLRLKK